MNMKEILSKYNCLENKQRWNRNTEKNEDMPLMYPIGYSTSKDKEKWAANLYKELEYYFISFPYMVFGYKNRNKRFELCYFLHPAVYGNKYCFSYTWGNSVFKHLQKLKKAMTDNDQKFEEFSTPEVDAEIMCQSLEGN